MCRDFLHSAIVPILGGSKLPPPGASPPIWAFHSGHLLGYPSKPPLPPIKAIATSWGFPAFHTGPPMGGFSLGPPIATYWGFRGFPCSAGHLFPCLASVPIYSPYRIYMLHMGYRYRLSLPTYCPILPLSALLSICLPGGASIPLGYSPMGWTRSVVWSWCLWGGCVLTLFKCLFFSLFPLFPCFFLPCKPLIAKQ